jgi:uncharacterized protein YggE
MATTAEGAPQREEMVVVGEGKITTVSDRVVLTLGVEGRGGSATQALAEATNHTLHIVHTLAEKGIHQADMQITWIGSQPIQVQAGHQPQTDQFHTLLQNAVSNAVSNAVNNVAPSGIGQPGIGQPGYAPSSYVQPGQSAPGPLPAPMLFMAGNCLRVILREPNRLGEMLDAAKAAGATFSAGMAMGLQDEAATRRAALQAAAQDACAKAEMLTQVVGRQLGMPLAIVEEVLPPGASADWPIGSLGTPPGGSMGSSPVLPGELIYRAQVRMTFALK